MSDERLTKERAIKLITSVVDGEVDQKTRSSFLNYIEDDSEVRNQYESIKRIKKLVAERCPSHKAPDSLKLRVQQFLLQEQGKLKDLQNDTTKNEAVDKPSRIPGDTQSGVTRDASGPGANSSSTYKKWMYAAAASFLIIAAFWGLVYNNQSPSQAYNIEEYVYRHFDNHKGQLIKPTIETENLAEAEVQLASTFDMTMTVPSLSNAEFKGVAINEFVPGYQAPLLEYYLPEEDQYIYIFAFDMKKLDQFGSLNRSQEAVKKCVKPKDFHIKNVNGKHVVSWRWNGVWYAAISNHHGETLASLVDPLDYETEASD
ncbi:hypothetical protein G3570_06095 [Balneolaceae bacterium YR4-1]|uniref:Uncharacterized protein n=1 Tax=Halalkalibaculum roseum TaxID=2709311 RepID=A0A6M1SYD3_9BACT|nr:hypothetical protein [Halalkalibaculum roseum]NGP76194.1 hypothetical protein [Halalkalibaculum roseum]